MRQKRGDRLQRVILTCGVVSILMIAAATLWRDALFYGNYLHVDVTLSATGTRARVRSVIDASRAAFARQATANGFVLSHARLSESPETRSNGTLTGRTNARQILWIYGNDFDRLIAEQHRFAALTVPAEAVAGDPHPVITLAEGAFFVLFLLMVISYGSLESRSDDPFSAPRGMHPAVVATQILLLGALGVATIGYLEQGTSVAAFIFGLLAALALLSVARWLAITQLNWQTPWLRAAFRILVAVTIAYVPLEAIVIRLVSAKG